MKTAFCTNIFPSNEIPGALKRLKGLGYDGVEFWHQYLSECDIHMVRKQVEDVGMEVAQICPYFNVTGTKEELRSTLKMAEIYMEYARALNCRLIRVFTGQVKSSEADEKTYGQSIYGLREICDMGRDSGLYYVLETHDGSLMDTSPATLRLLEDVGRDNLKVNLQVPLDYGREDIYESAKMLGEHVIHIHAHNWTKNWDNLTYLNSGEYDFEKFLSILKDKGFDGFISIEHGTHNGKHDVFEVAKKEVGYLKKILRDPNLNASD